MAFNYNLTTDRGKVRLKIGDTVDMGDESLDNTEVDHALTLSSDIDVAAVHACEFLVAKLRIKVSRNVKGLTANIRERVENTQKLLEMLKERAGVGELDVHFEGLSKADNEVHDSDTDFVGTEFSLGMDDYTGGVGSESDVD